MASVQLNEYKDVLTQPIKEGGCCLYARGKHELGFGVVVEVRKKVKVARCYHEQKYDPATRTYKKTGQLVVDNQWVEASAVSIVQEDWLYALLDAQTLLKMATIKQEVMQEVERVIAAKERKRARDSKKNSTQ